MIKLDYITSIKKIMKTISFISQKGGVGKSTLARSLATIATSNGLKTLLADCDPGQQTSYKWSLRREREPKIDSKVFTDFNQAKKHALEGNYDLLIVDGPAFISQMTYKIAQDSNFVIQPVKPYIDDLEPAVIDFNSLVKSGIDAKKMILVLNQVMSSSSENDAREYLSRTPYRVLKSSLPDRVSFAQAQNEGWSITEVLHPSLIKKTTQFLEELIDIIT
jgi:chromosome partitioning protein